MNDTRPADIKELQDALEASESSARALVYGLPDVLGVTRVTPGSWTVSECLDHLATGHRVYLQAMAEPANKARARQSARRRPAQPGWLGGLFIQMFFEPPPRWWSKLKAPRKIRPREAPSLADAFSDFMSSHAGLVSFVTENADLDLASIRFPNPFVPGLRFSLATGIHVLAAHERRHLQQAWGVRKSLKGEL